MAIKKLNSFEKLKIIDVENIIIGSGAGGSTVAYELLKKKKNQLLLRRDPMLLTITFITLAKA